MKTGEQPGFEQDSGGTYLPDPTMNTRFINVPRPEAKVYALCPGHPLSARLKNGRLAISMLSHDVLRRRRSRIQYQKCHKYVITFQ